MDQKLTIDLVEKHAMACKEQLSIENCDTNLKFYDQQKGTLHLLRHYLIWTISYGDIRHSNISHHRSDNTLNILVMQEFIRVYSIALLGNHIANKEPIPEKGWFTISVLSSYHSI